MTLSLGINPFILGLCLLVSLGISVWAYRTTIPHLPTGTRTSLTLLRFLSLSLILFLIFEPIVRLISIHDEPPVLAVLIDDSQSLSITPDIEDSALVKPGASVREALHKLAAMKIPGQLTFFSFSDHIKPLAGEDGEPDSLQFDGERTDISQALRDVKETLKGQNLMGMVLISDGQYNTGRNPIYAAERSEIPIFTVAVGDTIPRRDIQIRRIITNEIAYAGNEQPVQIGLRTEDYAGKRVIVSLLHDGKVVASSPVVLPAGTGEVPVNLKVIFPEPGLQRLQARVTRLDGEVTFRNNTGSTVVRVLKSKKRILLLAPAPSPDLAALHQMLEANDATEIQSYIQKDRGSFYEGVPPILLKDFDLIILAGYPGREAPTPLNQRIVQAARDGTPVLFLLESQTDLRVLARHFPEILPAVPRVIRKGYVEAAFSITSLGSRNPILDLSSTLKQGIRRLPPLLFGDTRWQSAPDARILATAIVRGVPLPDPLLVVRHRGNARSAALLGAGTWRWKYVPEDLDDVAEFWPKLFSNLLQWLTTREDKRPVRVTPIESTISGGTPVEFTGEVYDESLNPVNDASVEVVVTQKDGSRLPLTMKSESDGRYEVNIGTMPEGTYHYEATAERNGVLLGTDKGTFAVGSLSLEFQETQANVPLMRQIAARSGGSFFRFDQLERLPGVLTDSDTFKSTSESSFNEIRLWRRFSMLGLIIFLLTGEWFLRKRRGMV